MPMGVDRPSARRNIAPTIDRDSQAWSNDDRTPLQAPDAGLVPDPIQSLQSSGGALGLCANLPAGIETTQSGHSDIQHDKIRPKLLDGANRSAPVILGAGSVARNLQDQREAIGTVLVIVNDEDPKS
jgi:hypothetical protein